MIEFDTNVVFWLVDVVKNMQAQEDAKYADKLRVWNQNNQAWLQNAQIAFSQGLPFPTPPAVPTKEVFGVKDGVIAQYTWQDSTLAPPTFAPVTPTPFSPPSTDVGVRDAIMEAKINAILQAVLLIKSKLGA